jgi:uncharacterized protein
MPYIYSANFGLYFLFALPALLLGLWAQWKVKSAFNKYSKVRTSVGLTGEQVARHILDMNGLNQVQIEVSKGFLSDNYDPSKQILRLSPDVFGSNSIAAAGVAAHEAGHAIQDREGYAFLKLRSTLVPAVQIGSWLGPIIFMLGLIMNSVIGTNIAWAGLSFFGVTAVFSLITLPVELDASKRAKAFLSTSGVIYSSEIEGVNKVLDAAALTYVAAAIQAVSTVLYYFFLLTGRRRNN